MDGRHDMSVGSMTWVSMTTSSAGAHDDDRGMPPVCLRDPSMPLYVCERHTDTRLHEQTSFQWTERCIQLL